MTHSLTFTLGQQWLHDMWFTKANSTQAAQTDDLFMFILWICIFSFVLLMGAMFYFVARYRRRPGVPTIRSASHNTPLELAWSVGPLLILVPVFFWGFHGYIGKQAAPANAELIRITGEKWQWSAVYSNGASPREYVRGTTDSEIPVLIVPAGRPVKLMLTSKDVIHAFFIPDFRTKIDVDPNRYTSMWFQPLKASPPVLGPDGKQLKDDRGNWLFHDHHVFCAEYCGDNHSEMAAYIRVLEASEFDKMKEMWALPDPNSTPEQLGEFYWGKKFGCRSCHSIDGTKGTGPTWKDLWGRTETFSDGSTLTFDDDVAFANYVRESVLTPQAKIVNGFGPQMNSYQGQIKEAEIQAILAFMKSAKVAPAMAAKNPPASAGAAPPAGGAKPGEKPAEKPAAPGTPPNRPVPPPGGGK